jgi:hypothetical protein
MMRPLHPDSRVGGLFWNNVFRRKSFNKKSFNTGETKSKR